MIIASVAGRNVSLPLGPMTPIVHVLDHDRSVPESLKQLICAVGYQVESFSSAQEFLNCPPARVPSGRVVDLSLPDLNGIELPERLAGCVGGAQLAQRVPVRVISIRSPLASPLGSAGLSPSVRVATDVKRDASSAVFAGADQLWPGH